MFWLIVCCQQSLKCAGSQRVEDPALSNVPGLCRVSLFTPTPLVRLQWLNGLQCIYGLNNETTDRAASWRPATLASAILLANTLLILFMRARGLRKCTQNTPKCIISREKKGRGSPTPVGKRRLARDPAAFLNHFKHWLSVYPIPGITR